MTLSIRQQRQALRRQRRQQRQAQRPSLRRRRLSPHLSRRVRSSDIYSLDERQRHMAQAILNRRHHAHQLLEQSRQSLDAAAIAEIPTPDSDKTKPEPNPADKSHSFDTESALPQPPQRLFEKDI